MKFHTAAILLSASLGYATAFTVCTKSIISTSPTTASCTPAATTTTLASSKEDGGGWYDDYDDFVQKLDFDDGGWDGGANAPFDQASSPRGRGGRGSSGRGGRSPGGRGNRGRGGWGRDNFGGGGGGGDGGNDYSRDPSDTSSVDEAAVNGLISQRTSFRRQGMFDEADRVRDSLMNEFGVTVWDKDRVWTTEGNRPSGGGRRDGGRDGGRDRFGGGGRCVTLILLMCTIETFVVDIDMILLAHVYPLPSIFFQRWPRRTWRPRWQRPRWQRTRTQRVWTRLHSNWKSH
jgi:hypothetical protein